MGIFYTHPFDMLFTGGSIYSTIPLGGVLTQTLDSSSTKSDAAGGSTK